MKENIDYVASPGEFTRAHYFYVLLAGYFSAEPKFFFERHYYDAREILFITKGKGEYRHGNKWVGLVEGDCLIHDMKYPHAYRADPNQPFEMKYMIFDGHGLEAIWNSFFSSPWVLLHRTAELQKVGTYLDGVMNEMQTIVTESELNISAHIYRLILQIHRCSKVGTHPASRFSKPEAIEMAVHYLNDHYLTIEDIHEVAKYCNLSYYHFIRQFKRYFGCTPKEYILLRRINHAKRLLILTDKPITDIADTSGFNGYNSFLHSFHKIEKCSPSYYRKNWKRL